ncbi:polysaccharide deacetylase family protein [Salimicrobium flavidum]|uniref:Peptidoglycan/xylan/chitin deacetylase, PgdA/CDA1 family n=1 Tax=Salimicrobium flavidum TaxID=570947 RepID=A0A1N7KYH1_9BACI|nr:polysaccharide deacetylase family protein [Salimicrobium flavidum]SIS66669.1 Peptidoglycan/xylan/chitin deacetylase, PgdA/CDA1 family [Salimicrobium flavidum]
MKKRVIAIVIALLVAGSSVIFWELLSKHNVQVGNASELEKDEAKNEGGDASNEVEQVSVKNMNLQKEIKKQQAVLEREGLDLEKRTSNYVITDNDLPVCRISKGDNGLKVYIGNGYETNSSIHKLISGITDIEPYVFDENLQKLARFNMDELRYDNVMFTSHDDTIFSIEFRSDEITESELTMDQVTEKGTTEIPVLTYHNFDTDPENLTGLTMHPETFEAQMNLLKENGFTTLTSGEVLKIYNQEMKMPEKPVMITMDDGYESNYKYAYPVLEELDMKATVFVMTDPIIDREEHPSRYPKLTWEQMQEMAWSNQVSVQTHTHDQHHRHEKFDDGGQILGPIKKDGELETQKEYERRVKEDLIQSKSVLEEHLLMPVRTLAYPFGDYNQTTEEIAEQVGIEMTLSTDFGANDIVKDPEPFLLKRVNVSGLRSYGNPGEVLKKIDRVLGMEAKTPETTISHN